MQRFGGVIGLTPGKAEEYKRLHAAVWPDVLAMIRDYRDVQAPARKVQLSMVGFHESYRLEDEIQFVDYSTRELQDKVTPAQVLDILQQGNARFVAGRQLNRNFARQVDGTATGQHPLAEAAEEEYEHQDAQRDQQRVAEQVQVDPHRFTAR